MLLSGDTMASDPASELTTLLRAAHEGSERAADDLYRLVYDELRAIARRQAARGPETESLRPTALVHEAYLRLADKDGLQISNSRHFFFALSRAMRDIVVEHARRRKALRRGGAWTRVPLSEEDGASRDVTLDALDLHNALEALARVDPDAERVVELRCFAGLSLRKAAEVLGTTLAVVRRDWAYGVAWLHEQMVADEPPPEERA